MKARDAYNYRIHFGPLGGAGSFRACALVSISIAALVDGGEFHLVQHLAESHAALLMGRSWRSLVVTRVEREERPGVWRDRRWPIPVPASIEDVAFAPDGECLSNLIPMWPA